MMRTTPSPKPCVGDGGAGRMIDRDGEYRPKPIYTYSHERCAHCGQERALDKNQLCRDCRYQLGVG